MEPALATVEPGYSPDLSAELSLNGQRFAVVALGPGGVVVRSARTVGPGRGTIRMVVDGRSAMYHVELSGGIDPGRREQTCRTIPASEMAGVGAVA